MTEISMLAIDLAKGSFQTPDSLPAIRLYYGNQSPTVSEQASQAFRTTDDIQAAKTLNQPGDDNTHLGLVRYVGFENHRLVPGGLDASFRISQIIIVAAQGSDHVALAGQH